MNRRAFFSRILSAGALAVATRWLPTPALPALPSLREREAQALVDRLLKEAVEDLMAYGSWPRIYPMGSAGGLPSTEWRRL